MAIDKALSLCYLKIKIKIMEKFFKAFIASIIILILVIITVVSIIIHENSNLSWWKSILAGAGITTLWFLFSFWGKREPRI